MNAEKKPYPSQLADRFIVRFHDEGLRKQLKVKAAENERTLNAEILYLIKRGIQSEQDAYKAQP